MRTTYSVPRLLATLLMLIALYGLGVRVCRADEYKIGVINTDRILREAAPAKEERSLEGSWSGGGSVSFASGSKEQARCRAHYSRASKNSYRLNATCATASGKAAQIATVHRVGENKYSGNFHNPDYDITGTISVVVTGNSQSVRLTSSSGWAHIRLSR